MYIHIISLLTVVNVQVWSLIIHCSVHGRLLIKISCNVGIALNKVPCYCIIVPAVIRIRII